MPQLELIAVRVLLRGMETLEWLKKDMVLGFQLEKVFGLVLLLEKWQDSLLKSGLAMM